MKPGQRTLVAVSGGRQTLVITCAASDHERIYLTLHDAPIERVEVATTRAAIATWWVTPAELALLRGALT